VRRKVGQPWFGKGRNRGAAGCDAGDTGCPVRDAGGSGGADVLGLAEDRDAELERCALPRRSCADQPSDEGMSEHSVYRVCRQVQPYRTVVLGRGVP